MFLNFELMLFVLYLFSIILDNIFVEKPTAVVPVYTVCDHWAVS